MDVAMRPGLEHGGARGTVLVVDGDDSNRATIEAYLGTHGFRTLGVSNARAARDRIAAQIIDLLIVDIALSDEDALSLTRSMRERHPAIGIVLLTTSDNVFERIIGLEVGADDYLAKPCDPRELLARARSVLRRTSLAARAELGADRVRVGRCVLNLASGRLQDGDGTAVPLTPLEFDLLKALVQNAGRVLTRERILELSGSRDRMPFDRSVDLRIMRLRRKIEPEIGQPRYIRTVRHGGYVYLPEGA